MALKAIVDTLEGIPEAVHDAYRETEDGKYKLIVEGIEDTTGLKNNLEAAIGEKRKLQEMYKDIDPEKARKAIEEMEKLQERERVNAEKKLLEEGDLEKVVDSRTAMMRQNHENQVKQLSQINDQYKEENEKLKTALHKAVIERSIIDAANEVGQPRKEALEDIVARGNLVWKLNDAGVPIPYNKDGTIIYGSDGKNPQPMKEWAQGLQDTAPHFWHPSTGGGARGSMIDSTGRRLSQEDIAGLTPMQKLQAARNAQGKKGF